jgi:ABC-type amino acid transport substrate-binding protein
MWAPPNVVLRWPGGSLSAPPDADILAGRTLRCVTRISAPFVIAGSATTGAIADVGGLSGVSIDAFAAVASALGFSVSYTVSNGTYNSLVSAVSDGAYDCAVGDLSITTDRLKAVSFSLPYFIDDSQLTVRQPLLRSAGLFSFLSPFSAALWVTYVAFALACGLVLFVIEHARNEYLNFAAGVSASAVLRNCSVHILDSPSATLRFLCRERSGRSSCCACGGC